MATAIRVLAERLPRIAARIVDIDEADVLARSLVALVQQPPPPASGNGAVLYWEERSALLSQMREALRILALRQRDRLVLDCLAVLVECVETLTTQAHTMRQAVARHSTRGP